MAAVAAVGLSVTLALAAAAWLGYSDNEDRIIQRRTGEAAAVLEAAVPSIELPLATAAALREISHDGDVDVFHRALQPHVGAEGRFASASLWSLDAGRPNDVVGVSPALAEQPAEEIRAFLARAAANDGLTVVDLLGASSPSLGYAYVPPSDDEVRHLVYAEQRLPADRMAVSQPDSAFSGLDHALYLGAEEDADELLSASTSDLPLSGRRGTDRVTLGDAEVLLVMVPTEPLAGPLLAVLPWLVLLAGTSLTGGALALTSSLHRRREHAEELATENARLHEAQRRASADLQRSLLPRTLPLIEGLEVAAAYSAGDDDTAVGGDWYDVIVDGERVVASVGDVSGRGLQAAAVMAAVRYGMRTPAASGEAVDEILRRVALPAAIERDGHFATVLCGAVHLAEGEVHLASAGHPPPLLIDDEGGRWLEIALGPPIGVSHGTEYGAATSRLPARGTLLMFTDGLFERRGEPVDLGLERVREAAVARREHPLQLLVDELLAAFTEDGAPDDTAILALRWGR